MSLASVSTIASGTEGLVCYVCDATIIGKYYALPTCRTQASKVKIVEILGQLVGDGYAVMVSEKDTICRGCATMINSFDRLDKELSSLRSMILRYLVKKYKLEVDLVNTKGNMTLSDFKPESSNKGEFVDFQTRKRKAMCGEVDAADLKDSKDAIWLQCDRCKYTTHKHPSQYLPPSQGRSLSKSNNSKPLQLQTQTVQKGHHQELHSPHDLVQHLQEVEKRNGNNSVASMINVDEHFGEDPNCETTIHMEDVEHKKKNSVGDLDDSTTVEMITSDITADFQDDAAVATEDASRILQMDGERQMLVQSVEGEDGTNTFCVVDENGMFVQKVEQAEDGTLYVQMPDTSDPTKQVLSVGEDGSVQMVEVLWGDDIGHTDDTESHSIVNF